MRPLRRAATTGASGAAAVVALDSLLSRLPSLNAHPVWRGALRIAAGVAASEALSRHVKGATADAVADGLVAGPVLVTVLDLGVSMVGLRRMEPPPVRTAGELGAPWPPQPPWALPSGR